MARARRVRLKQKGRSTSSKLAARKQRIKELQGRVCYAFHVTHDLNILQHTYLLAGKEASTDYQKAQ